MLWGSFSSTRTEKWVRIDEKTDGKQMQSNTGRKFVTYCTEMADEGGGSTLKLLVGQKNKNIKFIVV